jgi:hypothetical protein
MKILSTLIILIGFSQCGSLKPEHKAPFKIITAIYENWVGGQPGVKGTNIKITYIANTHFKFDSIYFRNRVTKLQTKNIDTNQMVIGYFNTSTKKNDVILNADPIKELNNPIPVIKKNAFELKTNEAIISYKMNGKIKHYKIELLKKE